MNAELWEDLPGEGGFAVISPAGEGRRLHWFSWGAPGQIADLARMPELARASLPWLRLARGRIYAIGGSMGGQETLLLLGEHPRLLAGAAAFDPVADFAHQYAAFARLHCVAPCPATRGAPIGPAVQRLARVEVGGDPAHVPGAYAARSPINYARAIAGSCVPLELWWSTHDRVVLDPRRQALGLLTRLRRLNPTAPVEGIQGTWVHSAEMHPHARLPFALARLGLLPSTFGGRWGLDGVRDTPAPTSSCSRRLT
jgi:pimeloyl-ACP methyl ester carboxylesterase